MSLNRTQLTIGGVAVVAIVAVGAYFVTSRPVENGGTILQATEAPAGTSTDAATGAVGDLNYDPDSPLMVAGPLGERGLGDPNAPNVVIEYASLTCSHCRAFHEEVYEDFIEKYVDTGEVYFIMREFPLDPLASAAVMLARCVPEKRYFPVVDLLFAQQPRWAFVEQPVVALRSLVGQAGISSEDFQACLTNQEVLDGVTWVKDRGATEFGVNSTPTFFVNGEKRPGVQRLEDFDAMLGG